MQKNGVRQAVLPFDHGLRLLRRNLKGSGTNSPRPALAKIISIRPFTFADCLVRTIKIGQFGDVAVNACRVTTDRRHSLVEFLLAAASDEDICALIYEELRCSQPDALRAAGDNCNFPL